MAGVFVCGRSSVVERQLPKLNVDGSSPFARSFASLPPAVPLAPAAFLLLTHVWA